MTIRKSFLPVLLLATLLTIWAWRERVYPGPAWVSPSAGASLAFSSDSQYLTAYGMGLQVFDAVSGKQLWSLTDADDANDARAMAYCDHNKAVAVGVSHCGCDVAGMSHSSNEIQIHDTSTGTLLRTLPCKESVDVLAGSEDGRLLASAEASGAITVWDLTRAARIGGFQAAKGWASALHFSKDSQLLYAGGTNVIAAINWHRGRILQRAGPTSSPVQTFKNSAPGRREIVAVLQNGDEEYYSLESGRLVLRGGEASNLRNKTTSAGARYIAFDEVFSGDMSIPNYWSWLKVRDLATDDIMQLRGPRGHQTQYSTISVSPDGNKIAALTEYDGLCLWYNPLKP